MILLHKLLEKNRELIIITLLKNITKEIRTYSRIPRSELKEIYEHLFDAYIDVLVANDNNNLLKLFKYLARVRVAQSFPLGIILQSILGFSYVLRTVLQNEFNKISEDGKKLFNLSMQKIDQTTSEAIVTFSDVYQDYLKSRISEHNNYLNEQNQRLGIDLSRFILFRG